MTIGNGYASFIESKTHSGEMYGFDPVFKPSFLFDFQQALVEWAVRKGRAAIFADCGLGKTPMQLSWAQNVVEKTNGNVLILTPLAVSHQTVAESVKFNIDAARSGDGSVHKGITVTNYERLHHFDPNNFSGVVCDESSILKSFDGKYKAQITDFMRKMPYRLLCTATAAPNDYIELGTSSEAIGELGHMDMLNRFFKNDNNNSATGRMYGAIVKWRFKGHAELQFWRWVCSWARAIRRPSDIGFDNDNFTLPPLTEREHCVTANSIAPDMLFAMPAIGLQEQREERRRTIPERCEMVSQLVKGSEQSLVWCHLNDEGDILEKTIPDAVQVSGKDSDDAKEEKLMAFADGKVRVLVTKPKIGAWGLNFQRCSHVTFFPSHSFEQYYQGVRRCWRFGQRNPVVVDVVTSEGEQEVVKNLHRKSEQADKMFSRLVQFMNDAVKIKSVHKSNEVSVPSWMQ